jgi:PAS domain S-box-containing protein
MKQNPTPRMPWFHDDLGRRPTESPLTGIATPDYRAIFDNSTDASLLTAPDSRIVIANSACTAMLGYTEEELRQSGLSAVVDPSDPSLEEAYEQCRRTGRFRGELTLKRKDGTSLPVELSAAVFCDEHGAEWTSIFIRDITDRKQHEAERERLLDELDAERRWLHAVLEHAPLGIILFEPSGRVAFNPKTEELFGAKLSPTGGSAQYQERILFRDGTPVPSEQLVSNRVLRNRETVTGAEFLVDRPDGSRIPILGSAGPICDAAGSTIGGVGMFQDISDRMRAEEAVRASERLLNGMFELLPVGVWIADRTGRIVRANPAGMRIWGGDSSVDPSASFGELRGWWADTGKAIEADEWALARALKYGETSIGEAIRIECLDGSCKTIINSALPLYDDRGDRSGAIAVSEDITPLKKTEAALRDAVDSREQVLRIVAHDLRSPLQVILFQVQLLQRLKERRSDYREMLDRIRNQADRIDRLIQDLLDVTKIDAGQLGLERSPILPEELVDDALLAHRQIASAAAVALSRDVQAGLPEIDIDRGRIAQVFDNVIGNALKFTQAGGHVTVGAALNANDIVFSVRDTGVGMDTESLTHVFDHLWQARADRRGIGLGLAIAKSIVEAHGGRIWAESTVGQGSTFFFTVPALKHPHTTKAVKATTT